VYLEAGEIVDLGRGEQALGPVDALHAIVEHQHQVNLVCGHHGEHADQRLQKLPHLPLPVERARHQRDPLRGERGA